LKVAILNGIKICHVNNDTNYSDPFKEVAEFKDGIFTFFSPLILILAQLYNVKTKKTAV